jgi:hypothetical protein
MKAKLVKESLYETNFMGDSRVPIKSPSNRKYPLNAPNYEAEDSEGIPEDELSDDEKYLTHEDDEDVEVEDKWEKPEEDEEVDEIDDVDTSDMENVDDIEISDDNTDEISIALDNELAFAEPDRQSFKFRIKNERGVNINGVPLTKLKNGERYLFKSKEQGIKAYNLKDIILLDEE